MGRQLSDYTHFVKGLDPVADAFSATVYSDVVTLKNHSHVTFLIYKGVGATGTSTITVEACDDFVPTTVSAVAFRYRAITSNDVAGALTEATTAGFATTAGSSQLYLIEVDAEALGATGYPNVRLKAVEVVDSPVLGGIAIILSESKYKQAIEPTAIA